MAGSQITKVWGKVDDEDVVFRKSGNMWVCSVAPDLVDGTYSCVIYARNSSGETAVWCGFLYMCGGVCHFEFDISPYRLVFIENRDYRIETLKQCYEIKFFKECVHDVR